MKQFELRFKVNAGSLESARMVGKIIEDSFKLIGWNELFVEELSFVGFVGVVGEESSGKSENLAQEG